MGEDFIKTIFSEYGLAMLLLVLWNINSHRLYLGERKDRMAAWKAQNELVSENNKVLSKVGDAMIRIQERIK